MTSHDRIKLAAQLIKMAEAPPLHPSLAALSGAFGPIGTTLYERGADLEPSDRWRVVGPSALGASIGGGIGWLAGIPVSLATGIPILPTMAGGMLGGMAGSMAGAWRGASKYNQMLDRHKEKPKKEKKDEH